MFLVILFVLFRFAFFCVGRAVLVKSAFRLVENKSSCLCLTISELATCQFDVDIIIFVFIFFKPFVDGTIQLATVPKELFYTKKRGWGNENFSVSVD